MTDILKEDLIPPDQVITRRLWYMVSVGGDYHITIEHSTVANPIPDSAPEEWRWHGEFDEAFWRTCHILDGVAGSFNSCVKAAKAVISDEEAS